MAIVKFANTIKSITYRLVDFAEHAKLGPRRVNSEFFNSLSHKRKLASPTEVEHWSQTTLREKLIKIAAEVVSHGRYVTFQSAEVAVPSVPCPRRARAATT